MLFLPVLVLNNHDGRGFRFTNNTLFFKLLECYSIDMLNFHSQNSTPLCELTDRVTIIEAPDDMLVTN